MRKTWYRMFCEISQRYEQFHCLELNEAFSKAAAHFGVSKKNIVCRGQHPHGYSDVKKGSLNAA